MGIPVEAKRIAYDLDDSLDAREGSTRTVSRLKYRFFSPALPKQTLDEIPVMDHTPVDVPLKGLRPKDLQEKLSFYFHFRRPTFPGIPEKLREEAEGGAVLYAISGRKATRAWAKMTEAQLSRDSVPIPAENIILAPIGTSGLLSKADAIRQFRIQKFYEDDRRSVLYLAGLFPDVEFNYIDHYIASLTKKDLADRPNINVIPITEWSQVTEDESPTRNSSMRDSLKLNKKIAGGIMGVYRDFNPNLLTLLSGALYADAARRVAKIIPDGKVDSLKKLLKLLPVLGEAIVAWLIDGVDGDTAREKMRINPGSHNEKMGGLIDTVVDRWGGFVLARARMKTVEGNYEKAIAAVAGLTGTLPAERRNLGETKGQKFQEMGIGTMGPRTAMAILSTFFPKIEFTLREKTVSIPVQRVLDTVTTITNLLAFLQRLRGGQEIELPDKAKYPEKYEEVKAQKDKIIEAAKYKRKAVKNTVWLTAAGIGLTAFGVYRRGRKNKHHHGR